MHYEREQISEDVCLRPRLALRLRDLREERPQRLRRGLDRVLLEVLGFVLVLGAIGVPALQGAVLGADLSMGLPLFFVPVYRCFDYR